MFGVWFLVFGVLCSVLVVCCFVGRRGGKAGPGKELPEDWKARGVERLQSLAPYPPPIQDSWEKFAECHVKFCKALFEDYFLSRSEACHRNRHGSEKCKAMFATCVGSFGHPSANRASVFAI